MFHGDPERTLVEALVTLLLATAVVYVAARVVLDRASFWAALLTAVLGTLLATLVEGLLPGVWGWLAGAAVWAFVAAVLFRTRWLKGVVVGIVAAVLWALVRWAARALA